MAQDKEGVDRAPRALAAVVGAAAVALSLCGYFLYRREAETIRLQKYEELHAISELKAASLMAWRKERLNVARINSTGIVKALVEQWLQAPRERAWKAALETRLRALGEEYGYADVALASPDGRILLSLDPRLGRLEAEARALVAEAASRGQAVMGDVFRCAACGGTHLDTAAPIPGPGGRAIAVLLLRTDPDSYLYPLVQSWPLPSRTAETLLLRRDGGEVLYLSRLRHRPDPPLSLRASLQRKEAPAVQAALGRTGVFEGRDYRGEDVLTDVRAVPDTPWFIESKVDKDEFLSEIRYRGAVIAGFSALGILIAGGLGVLARTAKERRASQRAERRMRILLDILQQPAPDVQRFLDRALDAALRLTGSRIGYIYFYHEDRRQFVLNTWSKEAMRECTVRDPQTVYDLDKTGVWGEAVRQRRPIVLNDFAAPHPLKKGVPEGHARLRRFMTVPVFSGESIVAVVGVANKETDYDEDDTLELSLLMGSVWESVERRRAEEALARGEQLLRAAMDSALDAVVLMDGSGKTAYWNAAAEKIFGYRAEEVLGKDIHPFLMPDRYRERFEAGFKAFKDSGKGAVIGQVLELSARRKDGKEIPIEISVAPLPRDGKHWAIGVIRDISQRKQLERQRIELFRLLSHDLKNPLTAILAAMSMVHDEMPDSVDADARKLLGIALRNGNEMLDLIRGVLDAELLTGSLESGMLIQPLDAELHARRMVESLEPSARLRRVGLRVESSLGGAKVAADKRLLYRVVTNLLSNAIKFSPEGGEVLVGLSRGGSSVRFEVSDRGPGLPAEFKDRVFTARAQARPEDKTLRGGAGLGLVGVKQMVDAMGGELGFESVPGVRTVFFVSLPEAREG